VGNGQYGLVEKSPFRGIIVAASIPRLAHVRHLSTQLSAMGGSMVVPVGDRHEQILHIIERNGSRVACSTLEGVSFNFLRMTIAT
jgi:protein-L-isoaspartate O-methyltransferase